MNTTNTTTTTVVPAAVAESELDRVRHCPGCNSGSAIQFGPDELTVMVFHEPLCALLAASRASGKGGEPLARPKCSQGASRATEDPSGNSEIDAVIAQAERNLIALLARAADDDLPIGVVGRLAVAGIPERWHPEVREALLWLAIRRDARLMRHLAGNNPDVVARALAADLDEIDGPPPFTPSEDDDSDIRLWEAGE